MITDKHYSIRLNGVGCGVVNCKFHGNDNFCHANSITVESEDALDRGETFCGTFTPKASL